MRPVRERSEIRDGRQVTVVEPEPMPEEQERADLRAAVAELQAELAKLRPGWQPQHLIQPK